MAPDPVTGSSDGGSMYQRRRYFRQSLRSITERRSPTTCRHANQIEITAKSMKFSNDKNLELTPPLVGARYCRPEDARGVGRVIYSTIAQFASHPNWYF
jgi:hypothetical protein